MLELKQSAAVAAFATAHAGRHLTATSPDGRMADAAAGAVSVRHGRDAWLRGQPTLALRPFSNPPQRLVGGSGAAALPPHSASSATKRSSTDSVVLTAASIAASTVPASALAPVVVAAARARRLGVPQGRASVVRHIRHGRHGGVPTQLGGQCAACGRRCATHSTPRPPCFRNVGFWAA